MHTTTTSSDALRVAIEVLVDQALEGIRRQRTRPTVAFPIGDRTYGFRFER
jgi:hypothetical protein